MNRTLAPGPGQLLSVQVGRARRIKVAGRSLLTAMVKQGVAGSVTVGPLGLQGDEQADLAIHGGLDKAVYAYPAEHYAFWRQARREAGAAEIDDSLPHGSLGENLTLAGLLESGAWVGDVLRFANCALQITRPREPCHKLNAALGFARAVRLMAETGHCGFYLSVREPGTLNAGENFELIPGPRSVGIPELFHAKRVKHLRGEL